MWFVSSSKLQSGFILELLLVWLLVCFFVFVVVGGGVFFCGLVWARGPLVWWTESKTPSRGLFGSWKFFFGSYVFFCPPV